MDKPEESALLLIGHGSRLPHNKEAVEGLGGMIRTRGAWKAVESCFLEHSRPTIAEGLSSACQSGARTIVCVPVLIAAGAHLSRDIPEALGIGIGTHSAVRQIGGIDRTILLAGALGAEDALAQLLDEKGRRMLR
jgi:sirohydrochlorin cobaltochelatase